MLTSFKNIMYHFKSSFFFSLSNS